MTETIQEPQVVTPEPIDDEYEDYWNFSETAKYFLPDGKQWIEFDVMNEGAKSSYQKAINKDIKVNRRTGDASIKSDMADERHELIRKSVINWNMRQNKNWIGFSRQALDNWLIVANPKIIEALEFEIRKANPWLQGDMSVEDIDLEIERLKELREDTEKRDQGK